MVYRRDQPVAGQTLRRSQPLLLENTNSADDIFALDHYAFSSLDGNNGLHKKVTNPVQVSHPSTGANTVALYTVQDNSTIGPLQYSRGENDAVPTPLTSLHSGSAITLAPLASTNVIDFTGVNQCYGYIIVPYIVEVPPVPTITPLLSYAVFNWNGTDLIINNLINVITVAPNVSGNILRVRNNNSTLTATGVYWTLHFDRIIT